MIIDRYKKLDLFFVLLMDKLDTLFDVRFQLFERYCDQFLLVICYLADSQRLLNSFFLLVKRK